MMQKLIRGNTGAPVEMLQLALGRSGYLSEAPDGIFGPRTQNALLRFQKSFPCRMDSRIYQGNLLRHQHTQICLFLLWHEALADKRMPLGENP